MPRRLNEGDLDEEEIPRVAVPELPDSLACFTDSETRIRRDPKGLTLRLYRQVDMLLMQLEDPEAIITAKERAACLNIIARIQYIFISLRKETKTDDDNRAGSAVRKYAEAFANDAGRRKKRPRRPDPPEDSEFERDLSRELDPGDEELFGH